MTTKKGFCFICDKECKYTIVPKTKTLPISKHKHLSFTVGEPKCAECGSTYFHAEEVFRENMAMRRCVESHLLDLRKSYNEYMNEVENSKRFIKEETTGNGITSN